MGRDRGQHEKKGERSISIHSPRMGRDFKEIASTSGATNFNPLSPHGERPEPERPAEEMEEFQSTLPAWGETFQRVNDLFQIAMSIHSPRMGRDIVFFPSQFVHSIFQSTLPAWGET